MGKTENGKTGKSEIAQNLPGSPTTAARRRVTLRDVATAAGVSLKTASNVINGTGRMTDATRAIAAEVKAVIAEVGATSMKEMGKVMGVVTKKLAGRADGKDISAKVRELLS